MRLLFLFDAILKKPVWLWFDRQKGRVGRRKMQQTLVLSC